jgi:hypothetical protein
MRIIEFQFKRAQVVPSFGGPERAAFISDQRDRQTASAASEALGIPLGEAIDLVSSGRTVKVRDCQFGVLSARLMMERGFLPVRSRSVRFVEGPGVVDLSGLPVPALRPRAPSPAELVRAACDDRARRAIREDY